MPWPGLRRPPEPQSSSSSSSAACSAPPRDRSWAPTRAAASRNEASARTRSTPAATLAALGVPVLRFTASAGPCHPRRDLGLVEVAARDHERDAVRQRRERAAPAAVGHHQVHSGEQVGVRAGTRRPVTFDGTGKGSSSRPGTPVATTTMHVAFGESLERGHDQVVGVDVLRALRHMDDAPPVQIAPPRGERRRRRVRSAADRRSAATPAGRCGRNPGAANRSRSPGAVRTRPGRTSASTEAARSSLAHERAVRQASGRTGGRRP